MRLLIHCEISAPRGTGNCDPHTRISMVRADLTGLRLLGGLPKGMGLRSDMKANPVVVCVSFEQQQFLFGKPRTCALDSCRGN